MNGKKSITYSIIRTLCYSQIFSYPLTFSELWKYIIHSKKITREELALNLYENRNFFQEVREYIVLPGDIKLIKTRNERIAHSKRKLAKALWISNILSLIPTVKLIGISGSLSMYNTKINDDIDLFFITSKRMLWTTRFLVNIVLILLKEKRLRNDKFAKDKICPNMFMADDYMELPKNKRNLYTAHEVAQMKVLYSKNNTHNRFLYKNSWILKYLPNVFEKEDRVSPKETQNSPIREKVKTITEYLFYKSQRFYMEEKITNEAIGKDFAFFHPINQNDTIEYLYKLKIRAYFSLLRSFKKEHKQPQFSSIN